MADSGQYLNLLTRFLFTEKCGDGYTGLSVLF